MKMNYSKIKEFEKDFKKLLKKFPTLKEDLKTAKKNSIELLHLNKIDNNSIEKVPKYCSDIVQILKLKKFSCRSLKGKGRQSGIRVIYAFFPKTERVEFIELYYKGDKENMDYMRAKSYLKLLKKTL